MKKRITIFRVLGIGGMFVLAGCNGVYIEDQIEKISSQEAQEKYTDTLDTLKKGTEEVKDLGEGVLEAGKKTMDSAGNEAVKPLNTGKRTDESVKNKEQLLEEVGGHMIDDMRGSPVDLLEGE